MSARKAPSARTLGSQLVEMSTVRALMSRMLRRDSKPMPAMTTSMKAMTAMILRRMESLDTS